MLSIDAARYRAAALRATRRFFDERGYLEVDPPLLAPSLIPEAHIEVFATELVHPYEDVGTLPNGRYRYLVPSPEIWMKRLLAEGYRNIYSLGKSFRNAESTSRLHNPEFTMLEWYAVDADYDDQAQTTAELLGWLATRPELAAPGASVVGAAPQRITMAESFVRYAGAAPDAFDRPGALGECAAALGMNVGAQESDEDLYQRILVARVEPAFPNDHPVFLTDYPSLVPTLARAKGGAAERWELYIAGMEIANCYTEERDRARLEAFLDAEAAKKAEALVPHPIARELLDFANAPECSGVALGFDRLLLALLDLRDIRGVIFFP